MVTQRFVAENIPAVDESIGDRICAYALTTKGWTAEQLAAKLGVSYEAVRKWRNRETAPTRNRVIAIAKLLGKTPEWVLFGANARVDKEGISGPVRLSDERLAELQDGYTEHQAVADIEIPEFSTGGKMGDGLVLRDQPGAIHSWRVTPEWVFKNVRNATAAKNLCIVSGFGDSMRPLYNPGDPLLVDLGVTVVDFEAVYFFRVGNEGFIKRLQRIPGEGLVVLSENKSYRDWVIKPDMDFQVFGRVLKAWEGKDF